MKRIHIMIAVEDLEASTVFYSTLFGQGPTKKKTDYAKWMLDDPRINFSISDRSGESGIRHLGIQAETQEELGVLFAAADKAEGQLRNEGEVI